MNNISIWLAVIVLAFIQKAQLFKCIGKGMQSTGSHLLSKCLLKNIQNYNSTLYVSVGVDLKFLQNTEHIVFKYREQCILT